ncbi:cobalamin biosynthesis protein [Pseudaeromonas sharmana]|uniref:Cobalamin biosynthesis protein n=1 Tax=Pseudaeromonas sharmana TaxID=328412 RepID=A0ABV8CS33_9GAMM
MMNDEAFWTLLASPLPIAVLAVVLETLLPLPAGFRPSALLPWLEQLARKVNRPGHHSTQLWLAGLLTPLVVLIPALAACWALRNLSLSEGLFDLLLLVWLLELKPLGQQLNALRPLLHQDKLPLARLQLAPMVRRETRQLSLMGLSKACSETLILRWSGQWAAVLFWYLLAGIEAALCMRLLQLMNQAFSVKLARNRLFGEMSGRLYSLMVWMPAWLSVLLQGAFAGGGRAVQQALLGARQWPAQGQGALLGAVAGGLNIRLGGPRFYDGHKLRYVTLGGCQEPDLSTPVRVLGRLRWLSLVWWLLSALFCGLYLYVHWPR